MRRKITSKTNIGNSVSGKVYLNIHVRGKYTLVTVCDQDLIGKTLREGRLKLEVTSRFYGGQLATVEEAAEALSKADTGNLVGENAVRVAVENNLVDPAAVIHIAGVPHVQIVRL
jgi:hypothetical protein